MMPRVMIWGDEKRYVNYIDAVRAAGGEALCTWDPARAEQCAALLLPGGGDLEPWRYGRENTASWDLEPDRDAAELDLLDRFTAAKKPVLGICRGLQTINVFFGGTLLQDLPGHSAAAGIDRLHAVRAAEGTMGGLWGGRPIVNSAHHQAADRLGVGLSAVQWTADGVVEALCHRELPLWAVQWHPERLRGAFAKKGAADGGRLFRAFLSLCAF